MIHTSTSGEDLSTLARNEIIFGRDIEDRIDDLDETYRYDVEGNLLDAPIEGFPTDEYDALQKIKETIEDYSEEPLKHTTLYRDDYFPRFAEQFADDIGVVNDPARWGNGNTPWPLMHIDWEAAAEDLKQDYSSVEIDGVDFWFR